MNQLPKDIVIPNKIAHEAIGILIDLELLIRVNAPLTNGSAVHKSILKLLAKCEIVP